MKCSRIPSAWLRARSSELPRAVSMMIGTPTVAGRDRNAVATAKPSISGIITSSRMRSGVRENACASAVAPSPATTTSKSAVPSVSVTRRWTDRSSSTSRICFRMRAFLPGVSRIHAAPGPIRARAQGRLTLVWGKNRHGKGKSAAPSRFALHPDAPPVCVHEVLDDCQTEAASSDPVGQGIVHPVELLEKPPDLIGRQADPLIGDRDGDLLLGTPGPDIDAAAIRRVLDRVRQKIIEDLPQPDRVTANPRQGA